MAEVNEMTDDSKSLKRGADAAGELALLQIASNNLRGFKQQQWSTAYYGLLVQAGIIGTATLAGGPKIISGSAAGLLVALAWTAALLASWFLAKLHFSMRKERERIIAIVATLDARGFVQPKGGRQDSEFPITFSLAMAAAFALLAWHLVPNKPGFLFLSSALLVVFMVIAGAIAYYTRRKSFERGGYVEEWKKYDEGA